MIGVEIGGVAPTQVAALGRALSLHSQLDVVVGVAPSRFDSTLRKAIAVRAKDPLKPWEDDPEWVTPFVRPFTGAVIDHGRKAGRQRVWVDPRLQIPPEPWPDLGLVFVGGAMAPRHGLGLGLPADPQTFEAQVDALFRYLGVGDHLGVRQALRSVPRDAVAPSDDVVGKLIRGLDADEHESPDIAYARAHPNPQVRAAAARWLVRRGLEPEVAELLCVTRLVAWHTPLAPR